MGVFEEVVQGLGLTPRPQQERLVALARETMREGARFVQAGTGTGKSYAVLSVALEAARANGQPSVVVCPNNTLIDQYVLKDAPSVQGIAGGKFAHIKGRSRYVCANSVALLMKSTARYEYQQLTADGELEWAKLGLTEEWGCPGSDVCNPRDDCRCDGPASNMPCRCTPICGAIEARNRAAMADVIITNAHVLMWDYLVAFFTGGVASLLPEYGALFVDECHELESVGRSCLSEEITSKNPVVPQIEGLAEWLDTRGEHMLDEGKREEPLERSVAVQEMANAARRVIEEIEDEWGGEIPKQQRKKIKRLQRFIDFVSVSDNHVSIVEVTDKQDDSGKRVVDKVTLKRVCIDASLQFSDILTHQPTLLVSGTIPSSDRRRLGLTKVKIADVGHPFDYSQSTLIVSKYSPKESTHLHKRVDSLVRAIQQTKGGTLVLFTSWADLELVMPIAAERLPGIDVYCQSKADPATLPQDVEDFKKDGNAVLAGVRSLFTGLDVPGDALRQVVLWKLPYAVPSTEVKAIQDRFGYNVYKDQMMMTLVQAVGRLIRTTSDRGRVLILDSRAAKLRWGMDSMAYHLDEFART
jgi:ATP-dependent DNA helicase DinG